MSALSVAPIQNFSAAQATELSLLVDLEARWENLRIYQPITPGKVYTLKELQRIQKAYEAFSSKLTRYNKGYTPAHVPELLLNNPARLGAWCWSMRDLYLRVQEDALAECPVHLLAKAYRWADRLADRMKKEHIARPILSVTIPATVRELEDLARWCDELSRLSADS